MKYADKDISNLNDAELLKASANVNGMLDKLNAKRQHPKFKKIFENQPPPTINPAFVEMKSTIDNELKKRNLG